VLSEYAKKKKIRYFLQRIPKDARVLEVGGGSGWVSDYLKNHGWLHYTGVDIKSPADVVGDIRDWKELGLEPGSFDAIIAFEVVEHVDCVRDCYDLLRPGGTLSITTPVPRMDWMLKVLETLGLNQKRTSPHEHLLDLRSISCFERKDIKIVCFLSQWAILTKDTA
jgi:2-polyprenyl-3-methyl-5-hydroxy-6-metoxy-1,4-benzoquinol methylase